MKTKSKLWLGVCTVALCLGFMAFGVYSALSATLNLSGNLGFNMHNAIVEVCGSISPVAQMDASGKSFTSTTKEIKKTAMGGEEETVSNLNLGDLYFYAKEDMVFDFSFKNIGTAPINMTITIDLKENADKISIVEDTDYIPFTDNTYENYILADDTKQVKFALCLNDTSVEIGKNAFNINISFTEVQGVELTNGAYQGIIYTLDSTTPVAATSTSSANPSFLSSSVKPLANKPIYTATVSGIDSVEITDNYPNAKIQPFISSNGKLYMTTGIGNEAFSKGYNMTSQFTGLKSIKIPDSVTSIGDNAFTYCSGLTNVSIGEGVTSIGQCAFQFCSGLTSIIIPDNVANIGSSTFAFCSSLASIAIPNNVTSIGIFLFQSCTSLTSVTIPNSVTSIGSYAFYYCTSLTSVTIGNSVTSIGDSAFSYCSGLTSVTIGNSVTSIGSSAFYNCSGLTSVSIGNSVTRIGSSAFRGCTKLTSVTIPDSVTRIGSSAFSGCSISQFYTDGALKYLGNENNKYIYLWGVTDTSLTTASINSNTKFIGDSAFYNCKSLTSVTIPNSVTDIGNSAFRGCSGLTGNLNIPNSVTSIGEYAFVGCTSLSSVTIPNSITSIDSFVFQSCTGLTSVTIPNSVTRIGGSAFYECTNLKTVINNSTHITVVQGDTGNGYVGYYADSVTNP